MPPVVLNSTQSFPPLYSTQLKVIRWGPGLIIKGLDNQDQKLNYQINQYPKKSLIVILDVHRWVTIPQWEGFHLITRSVMKEFLETVKTVT
jgi:hypothetical protein